MIDIIMPHYREPWEVGRKFFQMLDLQRGINFEGIRVILVHDGTEPFPDEFFADRPYRVDQITIDHAGVSAARNEGLRNATAEWVMFCDFDDMFAHAYAMQDILNVLPAPGYDLLWMNFFTEDRAKDGSMRYNVHGMNWVHIHGKLYRRQHLLESNLWFDEDIDFNEDSLFNAMLDTFTAPKRTGQIKTQFPAYIWCFNPDSITTTLGSRERSIIGQYKRNKKVTEVFRARMPFERYLMMIARTVSDAYYALNADDLSPALMEMQDDFKAWFAKHKVLYDMVEDFERYTTMNVSRNERMTADREERERFGAESVNAFRNDRSLEEWLDELEVE